VRIEADAETVSDTRVSTLTEHSADAAMVFLPFRFHHNYIRTPFDGAVDEVLADLPVTAIVLAAEDIDLEAEPEEGPPLKWLPPRMRIWIPKNDSNEDSGTRLRHPMRMTINSDNWTIS